MKLGVLLLCEHIYDDPNGRNVGQSPTFQIQQARLHPLLRQSPDGFYDSTQSRFISVIILSGLMCLETFL